MATFDFSRLQRLISSLAIVAMTVLPTMALAAAKGRNDEEDAKKGRVSRPADTPRARPQPSPAPRVAVPRSAPKVDAPRAMPKMDTAPRSMPRVDNTPRFTPKVDNTPRFTPKVDSTPRVAPKVDATPRVAPKVDSTPRTTPRFDGADKPRLTDRRSDPPVIQPPKSADPPRLNPPTVDRGPTLGTSPRLSPPGPTLDRGPGAIRDLQSAGGRDADKLRDRAFGPKDSGKQPDLGRGGPRNDTPVITPKDNPGGRGPVIGADRFTNPPTIAKPGEGRGFDRRTDSPPITGTPRKDSPPTIGKSPATGAPPTITTNPGATNRRLGPDTGRTAPPDLKLGGGTPDDPRRRLDERFGVKSPQGTQPGGIAAPGRDGKLDRRDGLRDVTGPSGLHGPEKVGPDKFGPDWRGPDKTGPNKSGLVDKANPNLPRDARGGSGRRDFDNLKIDPKDIHKANFSERYRSGELDKVVKGETAHKLKVDEQYKYAQKGDVARRLDLQKNVTNFVNVKNTNVNITNVTHITNVNGHHYNKPYYHGWVSPSFHQSCFAFNYYGHGFFAGVCWYPRWNPWVDWSWHYHCHPIWDPRPIWCRPIIYQPAPVWVYYPVPVWQPLPMVASGTWVDVPKVVVPEQADIQLLAVRFVDPGHPEEKLGPRYRVWVRNNSDSPVTRPFSVVALASADGRVAQGLPQAGVRITSIEAGDTQSFDIRLPADVFTMSRTAQGQPAPFGTLHVIADANRELQETTRTNNGANVPREEILPVDPAIFGADPNRAAEGSEVVIAGEGLGPRPGQVLVNIGGQEFDAEIVGWYDLGARVVLPKLPAGLGGEAELVTIRSDGAAANPVKITLGAAGRAEMPIEPEGPVFPEF